MVENRATSMRHVGVNRDAVREAAKKKLVIGQQYKLKSLVEDAEDASGLVKCKLIQLSKNFVVFQHQNGTKETFTYQDIWRMFMDGEIK